MGIVIIFISLLLSLVATVYILFKSRYQYWTKRGIPHIEPVFPNGIRFKEHGRRRHFLEILQEAYRFKHTTPFAGLFLLLQPITVLIDLDLVHHVLVKDFNTFHDRDIFYNERDDPLSAQLFTLRGQKWRKLRSKLTPPFTSGKIKLMFPTILKVSDELQQTLDTLVAVTGVLEMKDILARFTTDIIGTCAFGINCNSLKDPDAEFRRAGRMMMEKPRNGGFIRAFYHLFPELALKLGVKTIHDDVHNFFMKVVKETVDFREKNGIRRNDFMDLLIQLKNGNAGAENITLMEIAAQTFLFFLAGFETSSTTTAFCLFELAMNPNIQQKAREEINQALEKNNGVFSYESIMDMPYLDCIISETLRKYPPVVSLERKAIADFAVPNTNIVIEKGMRIVIPVYSIHHDPEIYPDPETFDPDRFTAVKKKERHPMSFLGFGDGPRNCIGSRFGLMQIRVGLVTLLKNFCFNVCERTSIPLKFSPIEFVLTAEGGMWLNVERI